MKARDLGKQRNEVNVKGNYYSLSFCFIAYSDISKPIHRTNKVYALPFGNLRI